MAEVVVRVPDSLPEWKPVFLAGDGPQLGDWSATGVPLERWSDGTHHATLHLPPGFRGRFLATLGRWRDAEGDGHGHEIPAHEIDADGPLPLEIEVRGWGQDGLAYYPEFASRFLPSTRTITVWLPPGYGLEPGRRFPVFYMHDGQNLFDPESAFGGVAWRVDEVAEREIRAGRVEPVIVVGVANTADRLSEYGPRRKSKGAEAGLSRDYGRFLVEEVKPFIDAHFRTRPGPEHAAVGGSSMGGLISLHLCQWYPEVFGKCAAMSPSLWWGREYFLRTAKLPSEWMGRCRVWLDVGEHETDTPAASEATARRARRLAGLFAQHGMREGEDFTFAEVPGGTHHEASWGGRMNRVLQFLFGVS